MPRRGLLAPTLLLAGFLLFLRGFLFRFRPSLLGRLLFLLRFLLGLRLFGSGRRGLVPHRRGRRSRSGRRRRGRGEHRLREARTRPTALGVIHLLKHRISSAWFVAGRG